MCGRFALNTTPEAVASLMATMALEPFPPRYNIAPTQPILAVTAGPSREKGSNLPDRQALLVRWGLIPSWAKKPEEMPLLFNARSETAAVKASFRAAMRHRRALVPATGFYEWRREGAGKTKRSQPYWVRPKHGGVIAFAGLVETWLEPGGTELDTGAILTTDANATLRPIHHRMPVVIQSEDFSRWLDCITQEPRDVADLMRPADPDFFEAVPVSGKVNKVANMGPELQEAMEEPLEIPADEDKAAPSAQLKLF